VRLLVHRSGCNSRAAVLAVRRVLLHGALWLESGSHAATHVVVRERAVGLRGLVCHVVVVVMLGRETTAASGVGRIATVHVRVAHVAVRGLGRLAAQVLSLRGHAHRARLCGG
jgi:hypothetical protein